MFLNISGAGVPDASLLTESLPMSPRPTPIRSEPTANQRLWTSMRVLSRFSLAELVCASSAPRKVAASYLNALQRADVLRPVNGSRREPGEPREYKLIRNFGRSAPLISYRPIGPGGELRRAVIDPNSRTVIDISRAARGTLADRARGVNYVR